jgi:hypothetical protein
MRLATKANVTRFERRMRRLISHRAFVGSYLGIGILFFVVTVLFSPSRSFSDSLFELVVFCASLYFLLIAVLWAAQAAVGFSQHDRMTGVWMSCWTLAFLFLGSMMSVGAIRSLFSVAK